MINSTLTIPTAAIPAPGKWSASLPLVLALQLPAEAILQVQQAQQQFSDQCHVVMPPAKGFIPVMHFHADEKFLPTCLRWLERLTTQLHGVPVLLNNFSGTPPHQVYLRVVDHKAHRLLRQQLQQWGQSLEAFLPGEQQVSEKWMMPVTEQLPGMLFDKALQFFARQELCLDTSANALVLLQHRQGQWHTIQSFALQPATLPARIWQPGT